jgi:hypothetical protein
MEMVSSKITWRWYSRSSRAAILSNPQSTFCSNLIMASWKLVLTFPTASATFIRCSLLCFSSLLREIKKQTHNNGDQCSHCPLPAHDVLKHGASTCQFSNKFIRATVAAERLWNQVCFQQPNADVEACSRRLAEDLTEEAPLKAGWCDLFCPGAHSYWLVARLWDHRLRALDKTRLQSVMPECRFPPPPKLQSCKTP